MIKWKMENGTEELPKFSELGDFITNKSTKAAYCKCKVIFSFIKAHEGGIDECLRNFDHLSPLQLYDQCVDKTNMYTCKSLTRSIVPLL